MAFRNGQMVSLWNDCESVSSGRSSSPWLAPKLCVESPPMTKTEARTERCRYHFKVAEYSNGIPWITTEPCENPPRSMEHSMPGLDLRRGTTFAEAEEIAKYLNRHVAGLSITFFDQHPMYLLGLVPPGLQLGRA